MKTRIITALCALLIYVNAEAQSTVISNVEARQEKSKVMITYTLKSNTPVDIALSYSDDGDLTYKPCVSISGDLEAQSTGNKKIEWDCLNDGIIKGNVIFKVSVAISMVFVQGGTFTMGCTSEQGSDCYDDENPAHRVTVSSFNIGKYEVTQAQWKAVMGSNPSNFKGDNLPVERVSWNEVQEFIRKLNAKTGKKYRLPTEAEWEYAARGGNKSKGYKYSGSSNINDVAWFDGNSGSTRHTVGTKLPNELGIYDMSGNVYEWCSDWKGDYSASAQQDPTGVSSGSNRVNRGGSWCSGAQFCRVAYRYSYSPGYSSNNLGFRLVLP
jgi:formylglycine-generating enzyme required for sulfatase activity